MSAEFHIDCNPVAELFDAHFGFVLRSLRHLGVNETALEDAVQDVFVVAHRRFATFEHRSSVRTWLFGIARRVAARYRQRDALRRKRFVPVGATVEPRHDPYERAAAAQVLVALLETIDEHKRAVFVLRELEGMTSPEVATALGIPLGTVYSRLRAAWSVLGEEADRQEELDRLRSVPEDPRRQRRVWALLAARLSPVHAAPLAPAPWLASLKGLAIGALAGSALLAGGVSMLPAPGSDGVAISARPEVRAGESTPRVRATSARSDTAARQPRPSPRTDTAITQELVPAVGESIRGTSRSQPTERVPVVPAAAAPSTTPAPDAFTAEVLLLRDAQDAIASRKPTEALRLLDEHARRYAQGQLARERTKARIAALCLAGRRNDAARHSREIGGSGEACE